MAPALHKMGNALVPDAPMATWAKVLLFWAVYPTIKASGGLWVGGVLAIRGDQLRFEPNALNRAFIAGDASWSVGLRRIRSVRVEPAWVTNIVVVETEEGERRFRCYGADAVAAAIAAALADPRGAAARL